MSIIHLNQITAYLTKNFQGIIDISDYDKKSKEEQKNVFLTRALAAFSLMDLADISQEEASKSVVDGGQDNGIDAIYFDQKQKILFVTQSKWNNSGNKTIEKGEVQKLIKGFKNLLNADFDRFNKKIQEKASEIEEALFDAKTRFMLVISYTGMNSLSDEVKRDMDDFVAEMNDASDVVRYRILRQQEIYKTISSGLNNSPINLEAMLYNWGQTREPYQSYYGRVSAKDVALWWNDYFHRLFEPNIRAFLGNTEVNEGIIKTLKNEPEKFWYYNNGITALCSTVEKKPVGGNSRDTGFFECTNVSIVNGAQTVGSIAEAYKLYPDELEQAYVSIRFISLKNCPDNFATEVTQYNNTQNRIDRRDFVALDPEQERIKNELKLEEITYIYKSGESLASNEKNFNLDEATIALACRNPDIALTVRVKDKIGSLWNDINKAPYKTLFNSSTHGIDIWRAVQIMKIVDDTLLQERKKQIGSTKRRQLFATHANRLILHLLYQDFSENLFDGQPYDLNNEIINRIRSHTIDLLNFVSSQADTLYPDSYPANICKNLTKCKEIKEAKINT